MEEMDFLDKVRISVTTNLCFKGNYFVCVTDVNPACKCCDNFSEPSSIMWKVCPKSQIIVVKELQRG